MNFLYAIFYFFCLFSYVKIFPNSMDTQPFFIIIGLMIIFFELINGKFLFKANKPIVFFSTLVLILSIYNALFSDSYFIIARAFSGYVGFVVVSLVSLCGLKRGLLAEGMILFSMQLWLLVGLIQYFFGNDLFSFLVSVRTSSDRGVTSLAPEPTFYAFYITLIYIFYFVVGAVLNWDMKYRKIISISFFFQLILLSKSSMLIIANALLIVMFLFLKMVFSMRNLDKTTILTVILSLISPFILWILAEAGVMEGTRFEYIMDNLKFGINYVITKDASINDRVAHIYLSFFGWYSNGFQPGLFTSYEFFSGNRYALSNGLFWWGARTNRILSFWGSVIYELSYIAIPMFLYIFSCFKYYLKSNENIYKSLSIVFSLVLLLFLAIPISNPIIALIFSSMYYFRFKNKRQ
ncbi:hypothetical protein [Vibrio cyclitrophicus]|uniref:Wzy n=1 Tax=Vibrio cyclitrophicus ZF270 TaxID=1136176 RepID=A0AAN0LT18_9VIBR|nr:hypothetical protein [Vibrio cyclitrophicus]OEE04267.1 hypothetical protein OC7_10505 [Vibrio cyclitrophicus ZF270]